jgi:hypothetical protein
MKNTMKSWFAATLAGLATLTGVARAGETNTVREVKTSDSKAPITASVTERYASRYVTGSGSTLSDGAVIQDTLKVNTGKYSVGGWVTLNHDLEDKNGPRGVEPNVVVSGLEATLPLTKSLSLTQDLEYWAYHGTRAGKKPDRLSQTVLKYNGKVAVSAGYIRFLETELKPETDRFTFSLSRPTKVFDKYGLKVSVNPFAKAVWQDCHTGNMEGWFQETYGANASVERKNVALEGSLNLQDGNENLKREDLTYYTLGVKVKF